MKMKESIRRSGMRSRRVKMVFRYTLNRNKLAAGREGQQPRPTSRHLFPTILLIKVVTHPNALL